MASPDPPLQKILKAKKTMPTSSRKQIHALQKSRNIEALKADTGNQQLSTDVMHRKSKSSDMKYFLLNSRRNTILPQEDKTFPHNSAISLKTIKSNSKMNFDEQVVDPNGQPAETEDSCKKLFIQDSSNSQQTSCGSEHKAYDKKFSYEQAKVNLNLKQHHSTSDSLNGLIDKPDYILGNLIEKAFNSFGNSKGNYQIGPGFEMTSQSESHDLQQSEAISITSSNSNLMVNNTSSNLKKSIQDRKDTSDFLKTQEYIQTDHSKNPDSGGMVSMRHSSFDTNSSTSKKRVLSGNKENIKRMKTSNEINDNICIVVGKESSLFEQVKCLIQQEVCVVNYKVFDHKLKELNERVDKTQCRKKHEAIAVELLRKISKLDRRIKAALIVQRNELESSMRAQNVICKQVTNSKAFILNKNQKAKRDSPSMKLTSLNNKSSKPSEISINEAKPKNDLTLDCVEVVSESNDDVMLISEGNDSLKTSVTSTTDVEKVVLANANDSLASKSKSKALGEKIKHDDLVIDLTEEVKLNCKTAPSLQVLAIPMTTNENLTEKNLMAHESTQVLRSCEHLPSLPEPPQQPELTDFIDALPPQKFELKVKRVLKPKGIALTWNLSQINPKCAPVESYHLFICHETNFSNSATTWKKIGEIKALPLPMACTLSHFIFASTYYFTLQARDIYGRYGPFCDIKYIHGFSEDNIKESQILPT